MADIVAYSDELKSLMESFIYVAINNGHAIGMRNYMYEKRATSSFQESCEFFCTKCGTSFFYTNSSFNNSKLLDLFSDKCQKNYLLNRLNNKIKEV